MTIDISAAEALAAEAAHSFSQGLLKLAQNAANEAKLERLRLDDEAHRLEELRLALEDERRCLDRGFAQLAAEQRLEVSDDSLAGSLSPIRRRHTRDEPGSPLDIEADAGAGIPSWKLSLPLRASTAPAGFVEDCQGTLTRCSSEDIIDILMGLRNPEELAGSGGRVLLDFRPASLASLLKQSDEPEDRHETMHEQSDSARFRDLLDKFGLQGWIYQDIAQNLQVDSLLAYRGRRYTVLPPADPEEATVLLDMYDMAVTVPPGWEVLNTGHRNFDEVIGELSKHGWGTSLLCVKNAAIGDTGATGFSSYRTTLYTHGGAAGTLVSSDSKVLQAIGEGGRSERYKFSKGMVLSGRVVMVSSSGLSGGLRSPMRPPMTM